MSMTPINFRTIQLLIPVLTGLLLIGCAGTAPQGSTKEGRAILPWKSSGAVKIGYVRSDQIVQRYADYRDADNTLKAENRQWLTEAEKLDRNIQRKEAELDDIKLILSEERRKKLEDELVELRREYQKFRNDTWYDDNATYIQRRKELMDPIDARVNEAIWKISEEAELDLVFDSISGNIVYAKDGLDITDRVLEELQR